MTFWILAFVLAVAASGFVVLPFLKHQRRDQAPGEVAATGSHDRAAANVAIYKDQLDALGGEDAPVMAADRAALTEDLQRNLLVETAANEAALVARPGPGPWLAVAALPLFALLTYALTGSMDDLLLAEALRDSEGKPSAGQLHALEEQLDSQDWNHDGRFFLARAWMTAGEFESAAGAYRHLVDVFPDDAGLLAQYAEALFLADERQSTPRVEVAITAALAKNPHDTTLHEIRGMSAFNAGRISDAVTHFENALATTSAPARRDLIISAIARLRGDEADGGQHGQPDASAQSPAVPEAVAGGRSLSVLVELGSDARAAGTEVVFVYARAIDGPRMPLAIQRLAPADLPALVELTSAMAMVPNMSLDTFDRVEVVARLSRSGSVTPAAGDVEAISAPVDLTATPGVIKLQMTTTL